MLNKRYLLDIYSKKYFNYIFYIKYRVVVKCLISIVKNFNISGLKKGVESINSHKISFDSYISELLSNFIRFSIEIEKSTIA